MPIGTCPMCGGHCESEFAARLTDGLLGCPVCKQVLSFPDPPNEMSLVRPSECLMCWAKDKRIAALEQKLKDADEDRDVANEAMRAMAESFRETKERLERENAALRKQVERERRETAKECVEMLMLSLIREHGYGANSPSLDDAIRQLLQAATMNADNAKEAMRQLAEARSASRLLEEWWNEDPEMRLVEVLCGENVRFCVRLVQISFDEPHEKAVGRAEAATFEQAVRAALDAAKEGQ